MTRVFASVAWLLLCVSGAHANEPPCVGIVSAQERLACFDRAAAATPPAPPPAPTATSATPSPSAAKNEEIDRPRWLEGISLADEATLSKLGSNAATFAASQTRGERSSLIKAAVLWTGGAINTAGWQPVVAASINRNSLSSSPTDVRTLGVGLYGSMGSYPDGIGAASSIAVSSRKDYRKHIASEALVWDNQLLIRGFADGTPFVRDSNEFQLFPRYGMLLEHRRKSASGQPTGTATGGFAGFTVTFWPGSISDRLQLSAAAQYFRDFDTSGGLARRNARYARLSLDWYLFDRRQKDFWLQPMIGIDREVGDDPLTGSYGNHRTTLALKLKVL